MTVISSHDPVDVAIPDTDRLYTYAPLRYRERAIMKAALVREAGQPVFREQLLAARRTALQELAPDNLAELLLILDEVDLVAAESLSPETLASLAIIDASVMAVPSYAALIERNYRTVYLTPYVAARYGLRGWSGTGLPAFRRERELVPDDLLDAIPPRDLETVGWAIWNAAHVTAVQEKNFVAPSPSPESPTPSPAG